MFLFELALEMGKSVRELTTGVPGMSAYELCVEWPAYLEAREWLRGMQEKLEGTVSPEQFDADYARTMGGGA